MSKVSPHIILSTDSAMAWARHASIVKTVDQIAPLQAAPDSAVRIFRPFGTDPSDVAGSVNTAIGRLSGYRHPQLYVELWVLAHPTAPQMAEAVRLLHAAGVKAAMGGWGSGDYSADDWAAARASGADLITVQAYWASAGFTPWNALRYRQFWKPGDAPVIISECGRDEVRDGPNGTMIGQPGWQNCGITGEQYVAELAAYDAEIVKDSYVLGATVFTAGPTSDWAKFSTDSLDVSQFYTGANDVDEIAALQAQVKALQEQNTILTSMWVNFRKGQFTGADSIDGKIIAMQGGAPLGFVPSYPKV